MDLSKVEVNGLVGSGPNGETPAPSDVVGLAPEQVETIQNGGYSVAIVFHHLKTAWTELQRKGLERRFDDLSIDIAEVYGAGFDATEQTEILQSLASSDVDAVVSIPVDTSRTAEAYHALADSGTELVFMDNIPDGFSHPEDYAGCVSSDNKGVGIVAGRFLREFLDGEGAVGMITFDAPFYVSSERERGVREVLEETDGIEITAESGFTDPDDVRDIAQSLAVQNPEIDGLFVSWSDPPAIQAADALEDVGIDDITITTTGLSFPTVEYIASDRLIKATGAQFPYQQGQIEANIVAHALLGNDTPPYIASSSLPVYRGNLEEQYPKHYQEPLPLNRP